MNLRALYALLLVAASASAAPPPGYGPAFRVGRLHPAFSGERRRLAEFDGKLVLSAVDPGGSIGLWITDGTETGTRLLRPSLGVSAAAYMGDSPFVRFGGALYFAAQEYDSPNYTSSRGTELWRTDGTPEGTAMVADLNAGQPGSFPTEFTVARGALYFVAGYDGVGAGSHRGLFRTDGTPGGTVLVAQLQGQAPGNYSYFPVRSALTAAGPNLFLRERAPHGGYELHKVGSCAAYPAGECLALVKDLAAGNPTYPVGSYPDMLVALGDKVVFAADPPSGAGLFVSDGTEGGTQLLARTPYQGEVNGERLSIAAGGYAYLVAGGPALWRTDGTAAGTVPLAEGHATWQYWMTAGAGTVYFWGGTWNPPSSSFVDQEPWRTDGTVAGTRLLLDLCPGSCSSSSDGSPPLVLDPEGRLFFAPVGAPGGRGLWTSDGSAAGTVQVEDFRGITDDRADSPWGLVRVGDLVYFGLWVPTPQTPLLGLYDTELWAVRVDLGDRTPPALTCPPEVTAEATGPAGGPVLFEVPVRDNMTPELRAALAPPPGLFPLGRTTVEATATDAAGNLGVCRFAVEVRDTTRPAITCPADILAEAVSLQGAPVSFGVAAADLVSAPAVTAAPPSGTIFAPGTTAVLASAVDAAGNTASCAFTVTVRDTRAPALTCPLPQLVEAQSAAGAPGAWPDAVATDPVGGATVAYVPARGTLLGNGTHGVIARATDASGNEATCGFTVEVRDTIAPAITCPGDQVVASAGPGGAIVSFPAPTATDAVTTAPAIEIVPPSGAHFPVGVTTVQATARDAAGNTAACTFRVEVQEAPAAIARQGCATGPGAGWSLLAVLPLATRLGRGRRRG